MNFASMQVVVIAFLMGVILFGVVLLGVVWLLSKDDEKGYH